MKDISTSIKTKSFMKTGNQWSAKVHQAGWKLVYAMWEQRNQQLHHTQHIADMEGMTQVKSSITTEYSIGLGRLPASEFSHLFREKLEILLQKTAEVLKNWLLIVRQGRILLDGDNLVQDDFAKNTTLAKWLGLSFNITEAEGREMLQESIKEEMKIGMGNLPVRFQNYFTLDVGNIQQVTTKNLRIWLAGLRRGRLRHDQENILQDEFTQAGAFKTWLGM